MDLNKYKQYANDVGGEVGIKIHKMIADFEKFLHDRPVPPLLGNKEVAEELGISPKNMSHTRKTKFFPEPITYIGNRPFWLESSIQEYKNQVEDWRRQSNKSDNNSSRDG